MYIFKWLIPGLMLAALMSACGYEELKPIQKQNLTIASDYLYPKDSILFADFTKKTNIKVKITHISADSISNKIIQNPLNVDFDMIMIADMPVLENLKNKNLLQRFSNHFNKPNSSEFILITGVDPIVFKSNRNGSNDSTSYNDLSKELWYSSLDEVNLKKFYNCVKTNNHWTTRESALWIHQLELKKIVQPILDSLAPKINQVGFLSDFERQKSFSDSMNFFPFLLFPNQLTSGLIYNYYGAGIIYQSHNFFSAMQMIQYLQQPIQAQIINNKIGIISYNQLEKTGFYKNQRYLLNPNSINAYNFNLSWWNAHISYARSIKIEVKKSVPIVQTEPVIDSVLVEN